MPTLDLVTRDELVARDRRIERLESLLEAYVNSEEEWLPTAQALKKAGIKNRETLEKSARASRPGQEEKGRITWQKHGTKNVYARSSCIDYAQRKLGQPALRL